MDFLVFLLLIIGLPIFGMVVCLISVEHYLGLAIDNLKMSGTKWEDKLPKIKSLINILRIWPITGLFFSFVILIIYLESDYSLSTDIENDILYSVGMMVGASSFFMCLGAAVFYKDSIPGIVGDETTFGRYLVLSTVPMTGAIYGLLSSILLLVGVGLLGEEPVVVITSDDSTRIFNVAIIFSVLNASSIIKGYLPTTVTDKLRTFDVDSNDNIQASISGQQQNSNICLRLNLFAPAKFLIPLCFEQL